MNYISDKQLNYISVFLETGDVQEAGRQAGYSRPGILKLMSNPMITNEIKKRQDFMLVTNKISKGNVLEDLIDIKNAAILAGKTNPRHFAHAIRALEVINRMLGYNAPEEVNQTHQIETITVGFSESEDITEQLMLDE